MRPHRTIAVYGPETREAVLRVRRFAEASERTCLPLTSLDEVRQLLNRSFPAGVVLDSARDAESVLALVRELKGDSFTAIVPLVVLEPGTGRVGEVGAAALAAGADEVITDATPDEEHDLRLELALRRAARDVSVHPTTRLPGTVLIERDIHERIRAARGFAVCYADLDHFKEFNDRYGYNSGDRVILLLSRILRDVVRALAPGGFVGHIGGDDFIFNVSLDHLEASCDEIIQIFDELIPYQYTEEDRRAGYFLGRDRRGGVHRIPLMTLSIGVVTDQRSVFTHTGQVSELAAEMKSYAKSLPGSKYVVDRRSFSPEPQAPRPDDMRGGGRRTPLLS
ncbi:MAG: GGDEF domain-containing protein [Longimicrobiales bacterium]|nr:GGDEF domain-containing protein [Longimicrobiales bacterium]